MQVCSWGKQVGVSPYYITTSVNQPMTNTSITVYYYYNTSISVNIIIIKVKIEQTYLLQSDGK